MIDEAVCDFGMGAQWRHSAATAKSTHREVGNLPETYARFETVSYIHTFTTFTYVLVVLRRILQMQCS